MMLYLKIYGTTQVQYNELLIRIRSKLHLSVLS